MKANNSLLYISSGLMLFFVACKDNDPYPLDITVNGTVVDFTNNEPIAGAKVYFASYSSDNSAVPTGSYAIKSYIGITNADGHFSYSYTETSQISDPAIVALAAKEKYFTQMSIIGNDTLNAHLNNNRQDIDFVRLSTEKAQQKVLVKLMPKAYVKLHIKNSQPFDNYDRISISGNTFVGTNVDTALLIYPFEGNKSDRIVYFVTKNWIEKHYEVQLYTPSFDTTIVEINY